MHVDELFGYLYSGVTKVTAEVTTSCYKINWNCPMDDKIKTASLVALSASAVIASSVYVYSNITRGNKTADEPKTVYIVVTPAPQQNAPTPTPTKKATSTYKDGSYTAAGDYVTNNGAVSHKMDVSVTIANDLVTAASTTLKENPGAQALASNQKYNDALKTTVVGKKLDELSTVSKINGSSDTTTGFKAAVELIKKQAAY